MAEYKEMRRIMKFAWKLGLAAVLAALLAYPAYASAADKGCCCACLGMADKDGGVSGEKEQMVQDDSSDRQEDRQEVNSDRQEFDKTKFDMKLQRRLREQPIDAENGDAVVRVTAKTTDRGREMRQFVQDNGGSMGSCHGNIITAQMPYRTLPALSRLNTVVRIEGDIKLFPLKKKTSEAE